MIYDMTTAISYKAIHSKAKSEEQWSLGSDFPQMVRKDLRVEMNQMLWHCIRVSPQQKQIVFGTFEWPFLKDLSSRLQILMNMHIIYIRAPKREWNSGPSLSGKRDSQGLSPCSDVCVSPTCSTGLSARHDSWHKPPARLKLVFPLKNSNQN